MSMDHAIINQVLSTPHGEAAYKVVEALHNKGYDTWWVGGAVRDMLQSNIPDDIDIGTEATPNQIQEVFKHAKESSRGLGSMRVVLDKHEFELTTFRQDDEASNGRRPDTVTFGTREQDAVRRDFTINALYINPISKELYDPFNGQKDLEEKLVRFIGEPGIRIKHDALRLLRAVRLRSAIDGQYHPDTYAALKEHAAAIETLSGERRLKELEKMLYTKKPSRALEDMWELNIMQYLIPELAACKGIPQPADYHKEGDVWDHLLKCTDAFIPEDSADLRLAALFHDCGKAQTFSLKERIRFDKHAEVSADLTKEVLTRLQCSSVRRDKIIWLIDHHMMMGAFADMPEERKGHWYYHPYFSELLRLFVLDIAGTEPQGYDLYDEIVADYNRYLDANPKPEKPLLSGDDVIEFLGITPGPEVGTIMNKLKEAQERKEITSKEEARNYLKTIKLD